ncbi:ThuA domain-containing protein [bacterium]|nr:ThuA domain-containing protein [bacterium]
MKLFSGVMAAIVLCVTSAFAEKDKHLLLIGQGPDGHPPTTHEFMAGVRIMEHLMRDIPNLVVTTAKADEPWPEGPALIDRADAIVLFLTQGGMWMRSNPERYAAIERLAARGGGIMALHWAVGAKDAAYIETSLRFTGACHGGPDRMYVKREGTLHVKEPIHPIATGVNDVTLLEEFYYRLKTVKASPAIQPVLVVDIDGKEETAAWAWERPDGGRSFGFVGLHYHKNWEQKDYRRMVKNAILWILKDPIPVGGANADCPADVLELPKS